MNHMWLEQRCRNTKFGESQSRENHPGWWNLPMRGFSNSLLQLFTREKVWRKPLVQLLQFHASLSCVTEFTWWKKAVMLKSVTPLWLQQNKSIWEFKGDILATVLLIFTCRDQKQLLIGCAISSFLSNSFHKSCFLDHIQHIWSSCPTASFKDVSSFFMSRVGNYSKI